MHHSILRSDIHYPLVFLFIGFLLLLLGRNLFWLFVAVTGFVVGAEMAQILFPHQEELFTLLIAVLLGIGGAILAIFVQKVAVAIAGFVAGGYFAVGLCEPLFGSAWLCFVIGGILGALLMVAFFNWALIILSSLQGADWIIRGLPMPSMRRHFAILFVVLVVLGIVVQASTYRGRTSSPK